MFFDSRLFRVGVCIVFFFLPSSCQLGSSMFLPVVRCKLRCQPARVGDSSFAVSTVVISAMPLASVLFPPPLAACRFNVSITKRCQQTDWPCFSLSKNGRCKSGQRLPALILSAEGYEWRRRTSRRVRGLSRFKEHGLVSRPFA